MEEAVSQQIPGSAGAESEGSILAGSVGKQPSQDLRQPFCADDSLRARAVWQEG